MKTKFTTPWPHREVIVKPGQEVIGPGKPGAKSAGMNERQPMLETAFGCLPSEAITPGMFSDFLRRAGASHEEPEKAPRAIGSTRFSKSEREAILASVEPFKRLCVAVRSDECTAGGTGLWASTFILAGTSRVALKNVAGAVKAILASDFSRDVVAFKRRTGLPMEETPGVLVMPVDNESGKTSGLDTTPFHVNAITDFAHGDVLVQIGLGLGGANTRYACVTLLSGLDADHFTILKRHMENTGAINVFGGKGLRQLKEMADTKQRNGKWALGAVCKSAEALAIPKLREGFRRLKDAGSPPLYLELAYDGGQWLVVQCSDAIQKHVERPEEFGKKILAVGAGAGLLDRHHFSVGVSGRAVIESGKTVLISGVLDRATLAAINETTADYILLLNTGLGALSRGFSFADYSNAAAIVCINAAVTPAITHFNGALREAGIPVLAGEVEPGFLKVLKAGQVNQRNLLFYANDEQEEGFVLDRG